MSVKNLSFSLIEKNNKNNREVTYEKLLENVNEESSKLNNNNFDELGIDDYISSELNYSENYTKKQLDLIADYYGITKRKKRKQDLIEEIVIYEKEISNYDIVQRRKQLWFYMEEISNDSFLSKFLILG
jgi:hypothetical protein